MLEVLKWFPPKLNHFTGFTHLPARQAFRLGLVDRKHKPNEVRQVCKTGLRWAKSVHRRCYGTCPMYHIALPSIPSRLN